ncbi:MAG: hypothetical protein OXT07_05935 [bacterium]|nr:hypothetical protein [bacterium]MDE0215447.1 hypothetical protein [bacterium]
MAEMKQQEGQSACPICSLRQHLATAASAGDEEARALEDADKIKAGLAAMKEWEAEHGAFTEEEKAWAKDVLDRGQRFYENQEVHCLGSPTTPGH